MSIKPALTPEEWGEQLVGEYPYIMLGYREHRISNHGIAAKLLYGQPFGFTREDVVDLRNAHRVLLDDARAAGVNTGNGRSVLLDLADRIEALLPPEAP